MRYCTRCLYPETHPLLIAFDDTGVCTGCRVHEEKDRLDWRAREAMLAKIFDAYRDRSGHGYDCVVPVCGGRDSYYIVHLVKQVYGLNPLLVSYNRHYNTRAGIYNLARLRTKLGCDLSFMTQDPRLVKRVILATLQRRGSFHWHHLAGWTVYPVQTAVRMNIPLIVWGHHQGLDQVGMFSHHDEVEMTRKYRKEHDLMGLEPEDLADTADDLRERDLAPLFYPEDRDLRRSGVRGIYLGNYIRWDTKVQHEAMVERYDYYLGPQARTFDTYSDVDDAHYSGLHDHIKVLKHGYGKVTDHACREIRFGRLTREQGISLVRAHQDRETPDMERFLAWLGISEAELQACVDRHRDPRVWARNGANGWDLADSIVDHLDDDGVEAVRLSPRGTCEFRSNMPKGLDGKVEDYQLLTRGWVPG